MISMHTSPLDQPGVGDAGGMNVYLLNSAKQLAKRGVKVDIFTRATRPSQGDVVEVEDNLRVINIIAGPYEGLAKEELATQLAAFSGGVLEFVRCSEGLQYDAIHSHYWLSGQVGWLLRDLWNIPLIHTAHTLAAVKNSHRSAGDNPESEARRICEQQLVDNADVLVVNTERETEDVIEHYDASADRISIVSPGADTALFTPGTDRNTEQSRRLLGLPLNAKVIAFVGRLQEFKGPQVLLRATAELLSRAGDRDVRVVFCGGASGASSSISTYRDLAKELNIAPYVRFYAPRPPEELVTIYQAADIVAVPSYNESFGLVAVEAQATGTPVIAANVGGLSFAVDDGNTGVLVDGHDPVDWANALEMLIDDNDRRIHMGETAASWAQQFGWDKTAEKLETVYAQAIAGVTASDCHHRNARG